MKRTIKEGDKIVVEDRLYKAVKGYCVNCAGNNNSDICEVYNCMTKECLILEEVKEPKKECSCEEKKDCSDCC